jgi:serine-type D-Ala-D-Ala carboxypeptidase/endopeptidase (penicillin-binding protein 4)
MMFLKWKYIVVLSVCCCFSNAQTPSVWLKTFEQNKTMKQAALGFQVVEITSGKILTEHQSHLALIPASTLKVVTTSSSLCMLGKNYTYSTKILTKGKWDVKTGTIEGDIIIKGNGDPSLQSAYFYKDSNSICTSWALALKKLGVKTINGTCIGDASSFSKSINPNWIWGDIGNYFGASFNGLSFHDNKFSVFFTSGSLGTKATVSSIDPNYVKSPIAILSSVVAKGSEDEAYVYGDPYGFIKDISGNIPPNKTNYEVEAALPDPALLCAETFAKALKKENMVIDEKKCQSTYQKNTNDSTVTLTELHTHTSPSLERMVYFTNTRSNNHYAESFLATLGKGNTNSGIAAVKNYWDKRGLDASELFMVDGSGLSRANTVTANVLTQLLAKMARDSVNYKSFYNSLPIAGKNGSMTNIGKGTFIENNMRAKTGYINRVRTYCGYVKTKSGKELAFSILLNNYSCSAKEAKQVLEDFMIGLADL